MKIFLACPAPKESVRGNRITAVRWHAVLRALGHQVHVDGEWRGQACDLLIALHAKKSHAVIKAIRSALPDVPRVLCLTGTDLYRDFPNSKKVWQSLEWAHRIVVLQPMARELVPKRYQGKVRVIHQSAPSLVHRAARAKSHFNVSVLGHLRWEKDPLCTARALRFVDPTVPIRVTQAGEALTARFGEQARRLMTMESRYRWLGKVARGRARQILARSRAMVISSRLEGGANVVSEAIVLGVPVLASDIPGNIGLLGTDWPAYFPTGDPRKLAQLLVRTCLDDTFYRSLEIKLRQLAPLFRPELELAAWRELLEELLPIVSRSSRLT